MNSITSTLGRTIALEEDDQTVDFQQSFYGSHPDTIKTVIRNILSKELHPLFTDPLMSTDLPHDLLFHSAMDRAREYIDQRYGTNLGQYATSCIVVSNGDHKAFLYMDYDPTDPLNAFNLFLIDISFSINTSIHVFHRGAVVSTALLTNPFP